MHKGFLIVLSFSPGVTVTEGEKGGEISHSLAQPRNNYDNLAFSV